LVHERHANLLAEQKAEEENIYFIVARNLKNYPFELEVDSGGSYHIVYQPKMPEKREEFVSEVAEANGKSTPTTHFGTLVASDAKEAECELQNVLAIPEIKCDLLSERSIACDRINVGFNGNAAKICTSNGSLF
jgi:hypothetical protein